MLSKKSFILFFLGAITILALLSSPIHAYPATPSKGKGKGPALPPSRGTSPGRGPSTPVVAPPAKKPPPKQTPVPKPNLPKNKVELKTKYFKAAPKKDKSCFFTGVDMGVPTASIQVLRANTAAAKSQCKKAGLKTLDDIWKINNIVNPREWIRGPEDKFEVFLDWVSEIFAEESSGTAYVLVKDGLQPGRGSVFYSKEYPAMKTKSKVDKIMRVHFDGNAATKPTLPADTDTANTWWKKGDADPVPR